MSLQRKTPFGGLFSHGGTDKSLRTGIARAETDSSLSLSSLELTDSVRGPLGFTTLHDPLPPTVPTTDLVFIHGLGGGSRKTWSFSSSISHYWPLAWLPTDDDFADVRIHTFGYKADWGERRESALSIHDFAQSLLGELRNHPSIRRTATRIILVGHSMGGCVAKMTYILARQDPAAADIAARFHSIFFLGTPHRGSDIASMLESMLTVAWGRKAYVTDLVPNSRALSTINDTFRHYAPPLRLWSFFETLPVRGAAGVTNRIVVEKQSATLGYSNEEIAAMDADHRHVCKFETMLDPNYKRLRNALVTAIDMIKMTASVPTSDPKTGESGEQDKHTEPTPRPISDSMSLAEASSRLRSFLGFRDSYEDDDLATLHILKQPGSCQWFMEMDFFSSWKSGMGPGILWLVGRPAAGKSVLASHVIEQLKQQPQTYCSYFICKHGELGKYTLRDCFKSLALQMASQDVLVREALLQLAQDGLVYDMTDDASIWRRLFVSSIFRLPSISQHCWVVDGLDECTNFNKLFTKKFLAAVPEQLRFFATSRALQEIERGVVGLGPSRYSLQVLSDTDTVEDMRLFLSTCLEELGRPEALEDREKMCEKILEKSSGSFLWARLVMQEFENTWTEEAMNSVLQEVPADLHEQYSRMLHNIETDTQKLPLAKSILNWVVLASRPLSTQELRSAVKLDVSQTLQNVGRAIPDVCGQLVFIDRDDKVHMIHETAREFLVADGESRGTPDGEPERSPFVSKKEGHTRLGSLLLRYLCNEGLKSQPGKTQQGGGRPRGFARPASAAPSADLSLLNYASSFFSDHLYRSTSEDDAQVEDLANFLKTNTVLLWIEHIAKTGDLTDITRAAMKMREYLIRRMKYVPPTHPTVQLIDQWVSDLIRVAAKFRTQLLACPSSIHCLIPPMCPSDSIIARSFGRDAKRPLPTSSALVVKGLPTGTWDDCLIRLDFQKGQTTTICHGDHFFAIGLTTGLISLYDPGSVQRLRQMAHPERVNILQFSRDDLYLASCGAKHLSVWDPTSGIMTHSFPLRSTPLAVSFLGRDDLLCASQSSETTHWNLVTKEQDTLPWKGTDHIEDDGYVEPLVMQDRIPSQPPSRVAFLTPSTDDIPIMMAVGYRAHPVMVWNALDLRIMGICEPGIENNGIDAMVFSPNPDIPALVVSYQDGSLCVFDYLEMKLQSLKSDGYAHSLACSSDGRSLVTGSNQGLIEVFDFERENSGVITLVPIYRTSHPLDLTIRSITFSADGLRFIDVRGQQARVWAPAALVRKSAGDAESSVVDSAPGDASSLLPPKSTGVVHCLGDPAITSPLRATMDGRYVVAGNSSGEVALFSTSDASLVAVLYQHARGTSVVSITLGEARNMVISADDSGRIMVAELSTPMSKVSQMPKPQKACVVIDRRFGTAVVRMLVNTSIDRLLVCGRHVDELWEIPSGKVLVDRPHPEAPGATSGSAAQEVPPVPSASSASVYTASSGRVDSGAPLAATHPHSAFQHPAIDDWFVLATGDIARIYAWSDFAEQTSVKGIRLERPSQLVSESGVNWATATVSYDVGPGFVTELIRTSASASPRLYLWPAAEFNPSSGALVSRPAAEPNLEAIGPAVLEVLGMVSPSTLVFLDTNLWVCSTELQSVAMASISPPSSSMPRPGRATVRSFQSMGSERASSSRSLSPSSQSTLSLGRTNSPAPVVHARRHFFTLSEWQTAGTGGRLKCTLATGSTTPQDGSTRGIPPGGGSRDVVFATGHHLVIVKGGFDFYESVSASQVPFTDGGHTPRLVDGTGNQAPGSSTASGGAQYVWNVVSGSMHRRQFNRQGLLGTH